MKKLIKKNLDIKLKKFQTGKFSPKDFIIADAKDADMGGGVPAPGNIRDQSGKIKKNFKSLENYLHAMEDITKSGLVDIMLMSASNAERLISRGLFKNSPVTPAIRLNDTSDIWGVRHGIYQNNFAKPFRTVNMKNIKKLADLGLFSITFSRNVELDISMLNAYRDFRIEAQSHKIRHFLEVFNSPVDIGLDIKETGEYVNDCILKTLAGQVNAERPLFLKIAYNGPKAMEELASYDPNNLIVGILGGSKGTTRDCFELLHKASKYGAKVALFGRKINLAEDQKLILKTMRMVIEGLQPLEGVKHYHDQLQKKNIRPDRSLSKDTLITESVLKL